jgi:hypothetical protein
VERSALAPEANRLYWDSDDSVAEISNRLGVSRRALYEVIEPLASGADCPDCGAELYYGNRSAKASGLARCLACGKEREIDADVSHEDVGTIPPYGAGWPAVKQPAADRMRERALTIAAFAIAGALAGALITTLVRRER